MNVAENLHNLEIKLAQTVLSWENKQTKNKTWHLSLLMLTGEVELADVFHLDFRLMYC